MKIADEVMGVLDRCTTSGSLLFLPEQLDRLTYMAVDKILRAAGGKWNRSRRGHLFEADAEDALESLITTGQVVDFKKMFDQFETPAALAGQVVAKLQMKPGMKALEPNAGANGRLATRMFANRPSVLRCIEADAKSVGKLITLLAGAASLAPISCTVEHLDFMAVEPDPSFDVVGMNPPFSKRADVRHVLHAWEFLKPGGLLVSIMSAGVAFRSDKLTTGFREKVQEHGGTIEPLPADSFKAAGTGVNTVLVTFPHSTF